MPNGSKQPIRGKLSLISERLGNGSWALIGFGRWRLLYNKQFLHGSGKWDDEFTVNYLYFMTPSLQLFVQMVQKVAVLPLVFSTMHCYWRQWGKIAIRHEGWVLNLLKVFLNTMQSNSGSTQCTQTSGDVTPSACRSERTLLMTLVYRLSAPRHRLSHCLVSSHISGPEPALFLTLAF